jgi:hypothetical protein
MRDTPNVNTAPVTLNHRRVNGKAVDNPVRRKLLPPGVVSPEALELFTQRRTL